MTWKSLSVEELHTVSQNLDASAKILDVRTAGEFEEGHIPGALNISHEQVLQHVGGLGKFKPIYIICRSGRRAQVAADELTRAGLADLHVVDNGGMEDWQMFGFPTE